ncbi:MAG: hypothetical protein D6706_04030 [Chloroflexi bacterium]|nr:MAG: hypothetical protein D6706_04030 [Chloroflexota bacterium]
MNFLKKLFPQKNNTPADPNGIYFYVQCNNCGRRLRLRADKQHDLNHDYEQGGYVWHKTIVDDRCFRPMRAVVHLNQRYEITNYTLEGGQFITQSEYEAPDDVSQPTDKSSQSDTT